MKTILILGSILLAQSSFAAEVYSFEDAQKICVPKGYYHTATNSNGQQGWACGPAALTSGSVNKPHGGTSAKKIKDKLK